jgi:hypothetical protein
VGDLVGVGHVRQAGPEVKKLADTLGDHVVDHPLQQMAALDGGVGAGRTPSPETIALAASEAARSTAKLSLPPSW